MHIPHTYKITKLTYIHTPNANNTPKYKYTYIDIMIYTHKRSIHTYTQCIAASVHFRSEYTSLEWCLTTVILATKEVEIELWF
jgi:hypothetical protein